MNENKNNEIEILSLNPIRLHPQLYFSDFTSQGLCQFIAETIKRFIDPKFANLCTRIEISVQPDNSIVIMDNGEGLPYKLLNQGEIEASGLEKIMTTIYPGSAPSHSEYQDCSFLFNYIGPLLNAFSELLVVETTVDDNRYTLTCSRGEIIKPLQNLEFTHEKGTKIYFHPDPSIWSTVNLDVETLISRLSQLADEYPRINICMQSKQLGKTFNL
jgi:DNA gyrase subunit B